ncbi:Zinc finger protein-like 1 [Clonorchis sinensis]|uniref:Zinc finger protein-like 1 n=1 Tax=Clonorchis sinensis TaxID=79923 RepID=A0A8T1ML53_CLOSI|nr:Zinc finger protein-like 1 [Clonorchis sinensis]
MGLCKCERKRVTNLFCFEHRVNVCEFCMVASHKKCVVKSYLRWLKDSNFNPTCIICSEQLDASDKECVRLVCLDVFHWDCLNELVSTAPATTAPAGYVCPSCGQSIIPHSNHGGPVAEALRAFLERVDWAKPCLNGFQTFTQTPIIQRPISPQRTDSHIFSQTNSGKLLDPRLDAVARQFLSGKDVPETAVYELASKPTVAEELCSEHLSSSTTFNHSPKAQRREPSSSAIPMFRKTREDDDKYRRRVALGGIARWVRSYFSVHNRSLTFRERRFFLLLAIFFIAALLTFSHIHQVNSTDRGSLFDPHMNPDIHLDREAAAAIEAGDERNGVRVDS